MLQCTGSESFLQNHKSTIKYRKSYISAVIITKNESKCIGQCLDALASIVDEILVIDAYSEDDTVIICKKYGAKVVQRTWTNYADQKNYGNQLSKNDWILSIDADEVISKELAASIRNTTLNKNTVYSINRLTNFGGQWIRHSGWHPDWTTRLFNRKNATWKGEFVHEQLIFSPDFKKIKLSGLLYHYSYKDIEDLYNRTDKYTSLAAQELFQKGKKATWIKLYLSPLARFIKTYFIKKGILDGKNGWIISKNNAHLVHLKYKKLQKMILNESP